MTRRGPFEFFSEMNDENNSSLLSLQNRRSSSPKVHVKGFYKPKWRRGWTPTDLTTAKWYFQGIEHRKQSCFRNSATDCYNGRILSQHVEWVLVSLNSASRNVKNSRWSQCVIESEFCPMEYCNGIASLRSNFSRSRCTKKLLTLERGKSYEG